MNMLSQVHLKANPRDREAIANQLCRIWSAEHGAYWRENSCGYTDAFAKAGLYLFVEAWDQTCHCGPEKQIYYRFDDPSPFIPGIRARLESRLGVELNDLVKGLAEFGYEIKPKSGINLEWQERNVHFITGPDSSTDATKYKLY